MNLSELMMATEETQEKPKEEEKGAEKGKPESTETPDECMTRHEVLHHEHRDRIDGHEEFLKSMGYRPTETKESKPVRKRRRHD